MPNALVVMKTYLVLRSQMSKVIRASIVFDYYPDEDNIMTDLSPDEQIEYVRESMIEDIYSFVKYDEVAEAINVEVINV